MICGPCKAGRHEDCTIAGCDCPERQEQEMVERRLRAIRATDERLANQVYTTLLYGGSDVARTLTEEAGRDAVRLFVQQIIGTIKTMNC
jgi:hypothetical protein